MYYSPNKNLRTEQTQFRYLGDHGRINSTH